MPQFIECTSINITYDNLGLVSVNYTIVSDVPNPTIYTVIETDSVTFTGYVTNITLNIIPGTDWYETNVTLITTAA